MSDKLKKYVLPNLPYLRHFLSYKLPLLFGNMNNDLNIPFSVLHWLPPPFIPTTIRKRKMPKKLQKPPQNIYGGTRKIS
ncbi:hypothetical protein [Clostridioides difficile]|uniref:hypothetical protein n=1 Tax=Clostridioides difficile TaxID=1496 RepID=UPI0010352862|nr:hypothetical protein [Clostridioides difficile]MDV9720767.1 hypothetical protein [Clostridioides difficile]